MSSYNRDNPALTILGPEGVQIDIAPEEIPNRPGSWGMWIHGPDQPGSEWDGGAAGKAEYLYRDCVLVVGRLDPPQGRLALCVNELRLLRPRGNPSKFLPRYFELSADIPLPLLSPGGSIRIEAALVLDKRPAGGEVVKLKKLTVGGENWLDPLGVVRCPRDADGNVELAELIKAICPFEEKDEQRRAPTPLKHNSGTGWSDWWRELGIEGVAALPAETAPKVFLRWRAVGFTAVKGLGNTDMRPVVQATLPTVRGADAGGPPVVRTGEFAPQGKSSNPTTSARIEIARGDVEVRATPAIAHLVEVGGRTGGWHDLPWRFECDFAPSTESSAVDPIELWNSRLANDLLRSVRASFLPFFEMSADSARSERWQLLVVRESLRAGAIYRVILPVKEITAKAVLQNAGHGLPAGSLPTFTMDVLNVESLLPGGSEPDIEQAVLNPAQTPEGARLLTGFDCIRLGKVAVAHGAMLLGLSARARPACRVVLDGVAFELQPEEANPERALAWISLAGQMLVERAPNPQEMEQMAEATRWVPTHSHYGISNLTFAVSSLQPLAPSARLRARSSEDLEYPGDVTRSVRGDSRVMVVPISPGNEESGTGRAATKLVVHERARLRGGVALDASWERLAGGTEAKRLLLLQTQPLMIAAVEVRIGARNADAGESQLGAFSDNAWSFRGTREFVATLPPAVTGEAVVRGSPTLDPGETTPARFRFGPPTVLQLRSIDDPTGYAPGPWMLPSLLSGGDDNQQPGIGVRMISSELLYGLMMRIEHASLYAASVFRRRGWPVECWAGKVLGQRGDVDSGLVGRMVGGWKLTDRLVRSAAMPIEFYDPSAPRDEHLKIGTGVSWRLRENARLADPFKPEALTDVFPQARALEEAELRRSLAPSGGAAPSVRGHPLWGGVTIGFESRGVLQSFLARGPLGSTGGFVTGLHHGPHGATATFRSEFESGLLAIECVIEQGVVTRYSISRKGRIGCLWNRARHVVVYERTAIYNPRYTGRTDERAQHKQSGRAFLRKVDEYIEVLQPVRSYPDSQDEGRLCGCVAGNDFGLPESAKFRVEASWARDIYNDVGSISGWAIPIWLPVQEQIAYGAPKDVVGADPSRSGLHAKPVISLMMRTNRADGLPDHQTVEDPQKLMFYTRVFGPGQEILADTDKWPAVVDIDYCDRLAPRPNTARAALNRTDDHELLDNQPDADEPEIEPGFEPYTLTLSAGPRPANLRHGRGTDTLLAGVRTVLMSRAAMSTLESFAAGARTRLDPKGRNDLGLPGLEDSVVGQILDPLHRAAKVAFDLDLGDAESALSKFVANVAAKGVAGTTGSSLKGDLAKLLAKQKDGLKDSLLALGQTAGGQLFLDKDKKPFQPVQRAVDTAREELGRRLNRFGSLVGSHVPSIEEVVDQAMLQAWPAAMPFDRVQATLSKTTARLRAAAIAVDRILESASGRIADASARCDRLCQAVESERDQTLAAMNGLVAEWSSEMTDAIKQIAQARRALRQRIEEAAFSAPEFGALAQPYLALVDQACDLAIRAVEALPGMKEWDNAKESLAGEPSFCPAASDLLRAVVLQPARNVIAWLRNQVRYAMALDKTLDTTVGLPEELARKMKEEVDKLEAARGALEAKLKAVLGGVGAAIQKWGGSLLPHAPDVAAVFDAARKDIEEIGKGALWPLLADESKPLVLACRGTLEQATRDAMRNALRGLGENTTWDTLKERAAKMLDLDSSSVAGFEDFVRDGMGVLGHLGAHADALERQINDLGRKCTEELENLERGVATATDAARQMRRHAADLGHELQEAGRDYARATMRTARAVAKGDVFAIVDGSLALHRAFGHPPRLPGLEFNRKQIAYHFHRLENAIRTTPMGALMDRAGDHLRGAGIRLPTDAFDGSFVPALREALDLGKLFPDFAGLKLKDLFRGIDLSKLSSEHVQIRHEFNKEARSVTLFARVDYPLAGESTLVDEGVLAIVLRSAKLHAVSRLDVSNGVLRREASGVISADWVVRFGGSDFVTFRDTHLEFDASGKTKFDLSPEKVHLSGLLGFVSERLKSLIPSKEGAVEFLKDALGMPRGVRVPIDIPIPDTQGVTTGFSGLRLGAWFLMAMGDISKATDPQAIKKAISEFEVGVGFSLAKPERPFTLTAFILGGSGHLDVGLRYTPALRRLRAYVDVSMNASASLAFSVAGVSGGVYAYLGIVFRYEAATGSTPSLVFSARLMITGEVDVWGIVSASISIELRLAYVAKRRKLVAAGRLRIRIKICWCFTIKISVGFTIPPGVSDEELGMAARPPLQAADGAAWALCQRDTVFHACALVV